MQKIAVFSGAMLLLALTTQAHAGYVLQTNNWSVSSSADESKADSDINHSDYEEHYGLDKSVTLT